MPPLSLPSRSFLDSRRTLTGASSRKSLKPPGGLLRPVHDEERRLRPHRGVAAERSRYQALMVGQLWGVVLAAGEGTRMRDFLIQLCGGQGIKQFCAVIGRRSMLEHTLARVERLIPRERILIVVSPHHRAEVARQLAHWPADNVIFQPLNRETAPGVLLPLAHLSQRDPLAFVAVFPSDHFILEEERFMASVRQAVTETQWFPWHLTLLGVPPERAEEGYSWIEPAAVEVGRVSLAVERFWEKLDLGRAHTLLQRGALWNTFVCVAQVGTLWEMVRQAVPDLYEAFLEIRRAVSSPQIEQVTARVYERLRPVNFCAGVCEPLAARLRVLPVPAVGWSDWGSVEHICTSLEQLGKLEEYLARLRHPRE